MRRHVGTPLLALLAVGLAAGTASAARVLPSPVLIEVKAVQTPGKLTDLPPDGLSRGDFAVVHHRLLNARRQFGKPVGARVGHNDATLTVTSTTMGTLSGRATLPGGTILFGGISPLTDAPTSGVMAVLGGTGRFAGAKGTLTSTRRKPQLLTFRLTLP